MTVKCLIKISVYFCSRKHLCFGVDAKYLMPQLQLSAVKAGAGCNLCGQKFEQTTRNLEQTTRSLEQTTRSLEEMT